MDKNKENKKLEINVPFDIAERLYQAILSLINVLNYSSPQTDSGKEIIEESLLEKFLEKKIKEQNMKLGPLSKGRAIELSKEIKELITKDIESALIKLKVSVKHDTKTIDDVINLLNRYNRINKGLINGVIDFQFADNEINKIVNAVLFLANNLNEETLKKDEDD